MSSSEPPEPLPLWSACSLMAGSFTVSSRPHHALGPCCIPQGLGRKDADLGIAQFLRGVGKHKGSHFPAPWPPVLIPAEQTHGSSCLVSLKVLDLLHPEDGVVGTAGRRPPLTYDVSYATQQVTNQSLDTHCNLPSLEWQLQFWRGGNFGTDLIGTINCDVGNKTWYILYVKIKAGQCSAAE